MSCLKVDKDSFVRLCKNRIIEVSKVRDIVFNPDGLSYSLYSPKGEKKTYGNRLIDTIHLGNDLWMGFEMSFYETKSKARNVKYCLHSINLKFYHKKDLICRAEWDCEDENGPIITHPQPHWHFDKPKMTVLGKSPIQNGFVDYAINGEEGNQILRFGEVANQRVDGKQVQENQNENNDTDNFDINRIHFSISSRWPESIARNRDPKSDSIISWFALCIESMKEQHDSHYTAKRRQ